jgi:large subunit ribosomal protein L17
MRHGKKVNHLSRTHSHRAAMLSNMACSLIEHKRITTTIAKAKALRVYVEPILTKSKDDSTHARRTAFSYLKSKEAVTELFRTIAPKIADRPGGYTRIIRTGYRLGDNAEMCLIELVDFNEIYGAGEAKKTTTRRSRRGGSSTAPKATTDAPEAVVETAEETPAIEDAVVVEETTAEAPEAATEAPATETPAEDAPEATEEEK